MVLAYLLYGDSREYELEFLMSAYSALKCAGESGRSEIEICLVTDRPRFEPGFPFECLYISAVELETWTRTRTRGAPITIASKFMHC